MTTTAVPKATTTTVPSDQESMTPTLSWEGDSFPEYNGNHNNRESCPDDDWWNSELLLDPQQYDPFRPASTTTTVTATTVATSMENIHSKCSNNHENKSLPLRIIRQPLKPRLSLPTCTNETTSALRIQDVLERLDLDQTVVVLPVDRERTRPSSICNRASPNDDDTLDSFYYFWNTKSPCQWRKHHNNHKRQRCHPPGSPLVLEEMGHINAVTSVFAAAEDATTIHTFGADWTMFPSEDETHDRNHDGSSVPLSSDPTKEYFASNIEWSLEDVKVPPHSPTHSTNHQSISLEGSSLDGTTVSAISFTTPTRNNPKRKSRRARSKSLDVPLSSSSSLDQRSTTVHDKGSAANMDELSASLVSTANENGNTHSTILTNCSDDVDDDDANVDDNDAETNVKQSAVASISTANDDDNNAVCQLLRQSGTIQENDLLLRNNRRVLHRLAYAQLMGMHITQ